MKTALKPLVLICWMAPLAAGEMLVSRPGEQDVATTMDRLESIVTEKGMTVFARIDHQANAAGVGMEMAPAQVLVFGNPKGGTRIMQDDIRAGLDLPLRVLVYADADGKTRILYHDPRALGDVYEIDENPVPDKVAGALDKITGAAAQ